jgi:hypothetical protein
MKKVSCLFAFALILCFSAAARITLAKPSATLQKMWVEYDVTENNEYGMRIHIDFTLYELQGRDVFLAAYFQHADDQTDFLPDRNNRYHTTNGKVAVSRKVTPSYASSAFTDMQLFMPYLELDLDAGTYDLTINMQIVYPQGGTIAWLKLHDITYTQYDDARGSGTRGGSNNNGITAKAQVVRATGPRATFEKLWVDHNVTDVNGVKGMTIHFKFVTYDMKDVEGYVAVFFDHNDAIGGPLKDKNKKYHSSGGNVAVYKSVYPGYETANYDDLQVFMPYDEFDLESGTWPLSFEALLIYKNGDVISKFGWYDFEYTKPAR